MKETNGFIHRFRAVWTGFLLLGIIAIGPGQENRIEPQNGKEPAGKTEDNYTIRLAVEEARLSGITGPAIVSNACRLFIIQNMIRIKCPIWHIRSFFIKMDVR
jgi:hypothetical protein